MSGPKASVYELSPSQRKVFYEQREILKQTEQYLSLVQKGMICANSDANQLLSILDRANGLCSIVSATVNLSYYFTLLKQMKIELAECQSEYDRIMTSYRVDKKGYIQMSPEMHKERAAKLKALQELNNHVNEIIRTIKEIEKGALIEVEKKNEEAKAEMQKQILQGFSISFSAIQREVKSEDVPGETEEESLSKQKKNEMLLGQYRDKIFEAFRMINEEIGSPDNLSPRLKESFERIRVKASEIESVDFLENFYAISVCSFVKECKEYQKIWAEYTQVYSRYEFLCKEGGLIPQSFEVTKEGIESINSEIERLETEDEEAQTRAIINDAIDEAMREMGYDLVGSRVATKKSGKTIRHGLYNFGNGTGIDITFSGEGQITMELGGFDDVDRSPSEAEADRLVEDMQRFCGEYTALEKILEKKGISRKNIQMLPPTKEYAQIINAGDYDLVQPVDYLVVKKNQKTVQNAKHAD